MAELKQWAPSRWKSEKIRLYRMHVIRYAGEYLYLSCGPHDGRLLLAEIKRDLAESASVSALKGLGVALIGDK